MEAIKETINLSTTSDLPNLDLVFSACRSNREGYLFDVVNCRERKISRWSFPIIKVDSALKEICEVIYPNGLPYNYDNPELYYIDHYMTPHVVQYCDREKLFVSFGVAENGFCNAVIDTKTNKVNLISAAGGMKLHSSTGDFDSRHNHWYYCAWPTTNTSRDKQRDTPNSIEIWSVEIETLQQECVLRIEDVEGWDEGKDYALPRKVHQLTISPDGRYAIMSPFEYEQEIPFPDVPYEFDPQGYDRSYRAGIKKETVIIVDLEEKSYWQHLIPTPVPAHLEFDPVKSDVFYASAHNISISSAGTKLEGPAQIYKFKIQDNATKILGSYSSQSLYRITQHSVFCFKDLTLIAITSVPNKLVFVNADTMELWRSVELFEAPEIVLSENGELSPDYMMTCYSVNPTLDGRYIVLENATEFIVYDIEEEELLEMSLERNIPKGMSGRGHTRTLGQ